MIFVQKISIYTKQKFFRSGRRNLQYVWLSKLCSRRFWKHRKSRSLLVFILTKYQVGVFDFQFRTFTFEIRFRNPKMFDGFSQTKMTRMFENVSDLQCKTDPITDGLSGYDISLYSYQMANRKKN